MSTKLFLQAIFAAIVVAVLRELGHKFNIVRICPSNGAIYLLIQLYLLLISNDHAF